MALGPLEYLVIGFSGDRFTGDIMSELRAVREKGLIRLVDLVFIRKEANGDTRVMELSDLSEEEARPYEFLAGDLRGLLTGEDVEHLAREIPNGRAAAVVLFEHTWAIGLKEAVRRAGGVALAGGLVAPAVLQALEKELQIEEGRVPSR
jgi:Family of unknown function (DUF6325)